MGDRFYIYLARILTKVKKWVDIGNEEKLKKAVHIIFLQNRE